MIERNSFPGTGALAESLRIDEWCAQVEEAARRRSGRELSCVESDAGQEIWSWSPPGETGPLFLTRRAALEWMAQHVEPL